MPVRGGTASTADIEHHRTLAIDYWIWSSVAATIALLITIAVLLPSAGGLSRHMIAHIVVMNIAAPALAVLARLAGAKMRAPIGVAPAALLQLAVLWALHAPPVLTAAMHGAWLHGAMSITLLASSLVFWLAILGAERKERWRGVAALLVTGKLFCLLAALLVFSPRLLYPHLAHASLDGSSALADQHLAGLIMITVCPLSYVLSAVALVVVGLREIAEQSRSDLSEFRQRQRA